MTSCFHRTSSPVHSPSDGARVHESSIVRPLLCASGRRSEITSPTQHRKRSVFFGVQRRTCGAHNIARAIPQHHAALLELCDVQNVRYKQVEVSRRLRDCAEIVGLLGGLSGALNELRHSHDRSLKRVSRKPGPLRTHEWGADLVTHQCEEVHLCARCLLGGILRDKALDVLDSVPWQRRVRPRDAFGQ